MPVPSYHISCTKKEEIAPHVYEIYLNKPEGFAFKAGQFVLFDVPLVDSPEDIQTRAYSIAASPTEDKLMFVVKCYPEGRASAWVEQVLEEGTEIRMQGPFGRFLLDTETESPYLFIATGTGVAPFRSHLHYALKETGDTRKMDLIFGVVKHEDLFWIEELKKLEAEFENLTVHCSCLSGEPDWHGNEGSVQERIPPLAPDPSNISVYLCGAPEMVQEVKQYCLEELKIPKENVHQEAFV